MFNLFNQNNSSPTDVKGIRDALLQGIKDELKKAEGGEGRNIKGIHIYFATPANEKYMYESAIYQDTPERFKEEIQRIADDFDLGLPDTWMLEMNFVEAFPPEAVKLKEINAAIFIRTKDHDLQRSGDAYLRILNGVAEKKEYHIDSKDGKTNIGREKQTQVAGGFFRTNHIAFSGDSSDEANKYISRQHAHVEWNNDKGCFMLFADEGGIPPGNKVKVRSGSSGTLSKLHSSQIGHQLAEGDQVVLGETAVIEFSYKKGE